MHEMFGKGEPFVSDFKMQSKEEMDELTELMAYCNLQGWS